MPFPTLAVGRPRPRVLSRTRKSRNNRFPGRSLFGRKSPNSFPARAKNFPWSVRESSLVAKLWNFGYKSLILPMADREFRRLCRAVCGVRCILGHCARADVGKVGPPVAKCDASPMSGRASQIGVLGKILRHEIGYCCLERSKGGSVSRGTQFPDHGFSEILIA